MTRSGVTLFTVTSYCTKVLVATTLYSRRTDSRQGGVTNGDGQERLLAAATDASVLDSAPILRLRLLLNRTEARHGGGISAAWPRSDGSWRNAKPIVIVDRRPARTASFDAATMFMNGAMKLLIARQTASYRRPTGVRCPLQFIAGDATRTSPT